MRVFSCWTGRAACHEVTRKRSSGSSGTDARCGFRSTKNKYPQHFTSRRSIGGLLDVASIRRRPKCEARLINGWFCRTPARNEFRRQPDGPVGSCVELTSESCRSVFFRLAFRYPVCDNRFRVIKKVGRDDCDLDRNERRLEHAKSMVRNNRPHQC